MLSKKVIITDLIDYPIIEQNILGKNVEIMALNVYNSNEISDNIWGECDGIIAYDRLNFDKNLIQKLKKCKIISRAGIGYDNIDLDAAKQNNIKISNVPDYGIIEVSNHTLSLILSFSTGILEGSNSIKEGKWKRTSEFCFRPNNKILGIIGMGRIGSEVAKKALAFGLKVVYYDPYNNTKYDGFTRLDSLYELAENSDIISIHTPLSEETFKMIDDNFFNECPSNTCLINTARGNIIDIDSLYKAMKKGIISTCGLDVLNVEPPDGSQKLVNAYKNNEDWIKNRLIITPHSAFYSPSSLKDLRIKSALNIKSLFENNKYINCVK